MPNKSLAAALLQGKCPRCRQGDVFAYPATRLSKFTVMNTQCAHCELRFEPEPGFYQGAMYVSYAFTVAFIVIIGILLYVLGDPSEWVYIGVVIGVMVLLIPLNYRYSRLLYLYFIGGIKYDRKLATRR
ncbi:DUF983 domain-containing protein [Fulvivirgaceae bacterium PWU4]|uniref:DUF983 domain-containing protein n=2 Tax=Chryseosolibacter histidini TaxID=2782349 RepID=A0AAP2DLI8_9BACT|nr:DUF983 domain-containing protein [Chryseosolibacter histidini]